MSTQAEREYVSNMYSGKKWKARVRKMSDAQVLAIYFKAIAKTEREEPPEPDQEDPQIPF